MQKFNLFLTLIIVSLLSLFISCSNGIQDLIGDFNSNFTKTDVEQQDLGPDDEGFDPTLMLNESYNVPVSGKTGSFQVSAPKSDTYTWNLFDPDEKTCVAYRIPQVSLKGRYLEVEYSTSTLELGKTYLITLVVTDKEGKRYSDSAQLLFYQWYDEHTIDNLVTEITSEEDKETSADESDEELISEQSEDDSNASDDSS